MRNRAMTLKSRKAVGKHSNKKKKKGINQRRTFINWIFNLCNPRKLQCISFIFFFSLTFSLLFLCFHLIPFIYFVLHWITVESHGSRFSQRQVSMCTWSIHVWVCFIHTTYSKCFFFFLRLRHCIPISVLFFSSTQQSCSPRSLQRTTWFPRVYYTQHLTVIQEKIRRIVTVHFHNIYTFAFFRFSLPSFSYFLHLPFFFFC